MTLRWFAGSVSQKRLRFDSVSVGSLWFSNILQFVSRISLSLSELILSLMRCFWYFHWHVSTTLPWFGEFHESNSNCLIIIILIPFQWCCWILEKMIHNIVEMQDHFTEFLVNQVKFVTLRNYETQNNTWWWTTEKLEHWWIGLTSLLSTTQIRCLLVFVIKKGRILT